MTSLVFAFRNPEQMSFQQKTCWVKWQKYDKKTRGMEMITKWRKMLIMAESETASGKRQ